MIAQTTLSVRHAAAQDRTELANIIHLASYVHRHLDWRPPLDWLGHEPYLVVERAGRLLAALACPPDPPGIAWLRVFACHNRFPTHKAWDELWPAAQADLQEMQVDAAAAIPLQDWFQGLLQVSGFELEHHVVVLAWDNDNNLPPAPRPVAIRRMREDDLQVVQQIDHEAFGSLWRNSLASLQLAFNQASYATVAEDQGELTGYQISTPSPLGAHLARLAVRQRLQGQGIGYALVHDLQNRLSGLRPARLSVNTQDNNLTSLKLYEKAGFVRTSEAYPVYLYRLV